MTLKIQQQVLYNGNLIYTFEDGDVHCYFQDQIVVANPAKRPFIIHRDGTIREIEFDPNLAKATI